MQKVTTLFGISLPFLLWIASVDLLKLAPLSLVPSFIETSLFLLEAYRIGELKVQTFATGYRWITGLTLGVLFGAPIGVLLGQFRLLGQVSLGTVEYLRSIPVTALIPLFLTLFGIEDFSRIAMVILPTFLLMVITMQAATRQVSPIRSEMARSFSADEKQVFWFILIPEVIPSFFTGIRLSVSLSLVVIIVSEMFVGTQNGIGQRIYESYMTSDIEALFGYLVLLGSIGLTLNIATAKAELWALSGRSS